MTSVRQAHACYAPPIFSVGTHAWLGLRPDRTAARGKRGLSAPQRVLLPPSVTPRGGALSLSGQPKRRLDGRSGNGLDDCLTRVDEAGSELLDLGPPFDLIGFIEVIDLQST